MRNRIKLASVIAVVALAALAIGPREAAAQWGSDRGWERGAFDRGYQDGSAQGARDARAARPLAFEHYREYQRADLGYNRSYGTIEPYRRAYRQGFGQGYRESYGRYGRAVPAPRDLRHMANPMLSCRLRDPRFIPEEQLRPHFYSD